MKHHAWFMDAADISHSIFEVDAIGQHIVSSQVYGNLNPMDHPQ